MSLLIRNYLDTGDERFFEELIEDFQPLIKSYARKLYYLEFEDGVQELTLAIYEAVRKVKSTDKEYDCISYVHQIAKEIRGLDDIYKSVLELRYINDLSNDEIADFLGIKKKAVEIRFYRAKQILQERIKNS